MTHTYTYKLQVKIASEVKIFEAQNVYPSAHK